MPVVPRWSPHQGYAPEVQKYQHQDQTRVLYPRRNGLSFWPALVCLTQAETDRHGQGGQDTHQTISPNTTHIVTDISPITQTRKSGFRGGGAARRRPSPSSPPVQPCTRKWKWRLFFWDRSLQGPRGFREERGVWQRILSGGNLVLPFPMLALLCFFDRGKRNKKMKNNKKKQ